MTILEAIAARHSVRNYQDKPIPAETADALRAEIDACNRESGLHIQLVTGEPKAFDGIMPIAPRPCSATISRQAARIASLEVTTVLMGPPPF